MPSRFNLPPELDIDVNEDFTKDRLDRAWDYIVKRLLILDSYQPSYTEQVDLLRTAGLSRLNESLQPVYDRLVAISRIGVLFQVGTTTPNRIGKGTKTFFVQEDRRLSFAPAAYLQIMSVEDTSKALYGSTQSYDDVTGKLVVIVDQTKGLDEGDITNWTISAAGTPDLITSANDLGVYTQQQSDAILAAALATLIGTAPGERQTLGAISDAINARLQVVGSQGLSQGAQRQGMSNLGIPDAIKDVITKADIVAAFNALAASGGTVGGDLKVNGKTSMSGNLDITKDWPAIGLTQGSRGWITQVNKSDLNLEFAIFDDGAYSGKSVKFQANGDILSPVFGGSLYNWIEKRGGEFADDRASRRVAKSGDTMTGDLQITKNYPTIRMLYPGVRDVGWQVREDGRTHLYDYTGNFGVVSFGLNGDIQTRQFGDLNNRIEDRANAYAQGRVDWASYNGNRMVDILYRDGRMRFDNSGNTLAYRNEIGQCQFRDTFNRTSGNAIITYDGRIGGMMWDNAGALRFLVDNTDFLISPNGSDERLKENILPVIGRDEGEKVERIRFVEFDWREESVFEGHRDFGVVAQELEKIEPAWVIKPGTETSHYQLNLEGMLLSSLRAHQQTAERLRASEARLEAMEARLAALEAK